MLILTPWVLTFGTLPILIEGELMEGEPTLPRTEVFQPLLKIGATYADMMGRGQIAHTLSFTRVRRFTTSVAARNFLLAHTAALPHGVHTLTLAALTGGGVWELRRAGITSYSPRAEANRFIAEYTITGGALAVITPPEDVPGEGDAAPLQNTDGNPLLNTDGAPILNT